MTARESLNAHVAGTDPYTLPHTYLTQQQINAARRHTASIATDVDDALLLFNMLGLMP